MLCFIIILLIPFHTMKLIHIFYLILILSIESDKNVNGLGNFSKHSEACKKLLESFATASAGFMFCSVQNARPVHICCSCIHDYNKVLDEYKQITQLRPNSTCNERLINQDRLEIIENSFSFIKDLWLKGQCKNCFENENSLSNKTKEFIELYTDMNHCSESQYNPVNQTYNSDICQICSEKYYKMSKFYTELKEITGNGNVCMDIVDSVNVTQHLWSNVLHCGETVMTVEIPLIALSITFFIIPIFFYAYAWIFTKDRTSAVLNQNRISQRFRECWKSRTGSSIST